MQAPRLAVVLLVSAALNLFLIGALGVFLYRQSQHAPLVTPPMNVALEGLTPAHRAAFDAMLRAEAVKLRPMVRDAKLARRRAAAMLAQPQMDRVKVLATLEEARTQEDRARAELEEQVVAFAAPLRPDERKSLAIVLKRGMKTNRRTLGADASPAPIGKRNAER